MSEELSAWQKYKQNLGEVRPWDFLDINTEYVSKEVSESRLDICRACPELIQLTSTCKKCGCFMTAKSKLAKASCPLEKW
jgi:hypothetical protein